MARKKKSSAKRPFMCGICGHLYTSKELSLACEMHCRAKRRPGRKIISHAVMPKRHAIRQYLAQGRASWIFMLWAAIFILNSAYNFFNLMPFIGQLWVGIIFFLGAIVFCPCYAERTCRIIGIVG